MSLDVKHTILIVEDEIPLQKVVGYKLEKAGFAIVMARDVQQALKILHSVNSIDLIWLDHYLIGTDTGLDLVANLKRSKEFNHIPVMVVSNSSNNSIKHTYLRLGIDRFYIKADLKLDAVVADINHILNKS